MQREILMGFYTLQELKVGKWQCCSASAVPYLELNPKCKCITGTMHYDSRLPSASLRKHGWEWMEDWMLYAHSVGNRTGVGDATYPGNSHCPRIPLGSLRHRWPCPAHRAQLSLSHQNHRPTQHSPASHQSVGARALVGRRLACMLCNGLLGRLWEVPVGSCLSSVMELAHHPAGLIQGCSNKVRMGGMPAGPTRLSGKRLST